MVSIIRPIPSNLSSPSRSQQGRSTSPFSRTGRVGELSRLTGPDYRRSGYTSEAVRLLLAHLFHNSNINKVMAQTGEFNEASIALLTSLGFTQDGRLRQHHVIDGTYYDDLIFSILAEDFGKKV